jgi:hypothetical protein
MNAPGKLITPLSQLRHLKAMQILICNHLRHSDILCGSIPLSHVTTGYDLALNHMKYQDFAFREFLLPLISNTLMLEITKQPIGINGQIGSMYPFA